MKNNEIIGIDVSKLTLDVCIHSKGEHAKFENDTTGFKLLLSWVWKHTKFSKEETLFVFENTGIYSHNLAAFLNQKKLPFYIASGLEIKRSIGITRGKNDAIDAKRIALYGFRLREELEPTKPIDSNISVLKSLNNFCKRLIRQRAGFKSSLKEMKSVYKVKDYKDLFDSQVIMIENLTKEIDKMEDKIREIIKANQTLNNSFNLITSVRSVGSKTAVALIITTENFTKFKDARKFNSYCGIAPFENQSGTSIRGKTKVSNLANKEIKSLIHMCAVSSLLYNPEMKYYFNRKIKEGKNKMTVINSIRNKLIARVFAVIKRQTPYVETMQYAY